MQSIPQAPEAAVVRRAVRESAQLDDSNFGIGVDTVDGLAFPKRRRHRERADLHQDGILHLDRLAIGPSVGQDPCDGAGKDNDRSESEEQASAQGFDHVERSTIHPTPRTLRIDFAPSFLRTAWIKNSTALLSTSSLQP